jgi:hypothetical protein
MIRMNRLVSAVLFGAGLQALQSQATLDCCKYPTAYTQQGPQCHRDGILPWLVGIPGAWETELRLGAAGNTVSFSFSSSLPLTSTSWGTNMVLEDSQWGSTFFESLTGLDLPKYGSHWTRILGACDNAAGQCPVRDATGSMFINAGATDAAALDAISAFGIYKYTSNGGVVSQTTAPVIFLDQAAVRWTAIVLDTPGAQQSQPGATITSFAVANLAPDPQAVLIRVYAERGQLVASGKTPILRSVFDWGDVHAGMLSNVLETNLPPSSCPTLAQGLPAVGLQCAESPVFRGTVVFEGENGGKIAPVVFRFNGSAMTTVPVKAE